ncbi:MAG: acyl--CoA ligase [Prevotella sp.]|nr:acyl--CoA ligase [Prevotella sp.]
MAKRLPSVERPWLRYHSRADIEAPIPTTTVYQLLVENNREHSFDTALLYLDTVITYGQLFSSIDNCAKGLRAMGVRRDDIVTVAMPAMPEAVVAFYAINRLGAVANMIHPLASAEDTCRYLREVGSRVFLMFTGTCRLVASHLHTTMVEKAVVVPVGDDDIPQPSPEWPELMTWKEMEELGCGMELPPPARAAHDYALISHTGGTTGEQKGVVCTNLNIQAEIFQGLAGIEYQRQECIMATLPPFINYSLVSTILRHLSHGLKVVLIPHYQPEKFVEYVTKYHVNHILTIPAYWKAILHIPGIDQADLSSLRFLASGGEHIDLHTEEAVNSLLKHCGAKGGLIKGTGMTEMTCATTYSLPWRNPPGSVGSPLVKTNCKVVDPDSGEELSYGQEGEVCFAGPTLMAGYYNNPEATRQVVHTGDDGTPWLHTGDLGYITDDGMLFITGRMKRLLLVRDANGVISKVFPDRVEEVLMTVPGVEACCVVGVPDEQRITIAKAFVQPTKEMEKSSQLKESILDVCRQQLSPYMMPEEVVFITEMPRTERGKIDFRALEKAE